MNEKPAPEEQIGIDEMSLSVNAWRRLAAYGFKNQAEVRAQYNAMMAIPGIGKETRHSVRHALKEHDEQYEKWLKDEPERERDRYRAVLDEILDRCLLFDKHDPGLELHPNELERLIHTVIPEYPRAKPRVNRALTESTAQSTEPEASTASAPPTPAPKP